MRLYQSRRPLFAACLGCAAIAVACGIGIRRDYSAIPVGQIGFDDLCGLQDYFDTIEAKLAKAPALVNAVDIENQADKRVQGGKNRFAFETEFQLKQLRRVLDDNWSRLPEPLATATRVDIEVHWSEKAGVRRVVTDGEAELTIGRDSFALPYHVCLSELLFGEPLYRQRREMTGRPLPYKSILGDGGIGPEPDAGPAAAPATGSPGPAPAAKPDAGDRPPAPTGPVGGTVTPSIFKSAPPAQ
jgi:hypothetical protein